MVDKRISKFAHPNPEELENHKNPLVREIYHIMYKENRNCMIVIVGDPGSGKSYTALGLCNIFDPLGFNADTIEKRCITKPKDFVNAIVDEEKNLTFGSALLADEAGTSIPSREWASFNNKAVDYISQTFRYKRLLVVMSCPSLELIDVHIRKYFAYMIEAEKVDFSNGLNICRVFKLSTSKRDGKMYFIYPRYKKDGKRIKVARFEFDKPDTKLCHKYEKLSQEFKAKLALDLKKAGDKMEAKEIKRNVDVDEIVDKIIANKERYARIHGNTIRINKELIEGDFDVGAGYSRRIKRMVEQKLKDTDALNTKPIIKLKDIELLKWIFTWSSLSKFYI